MSMRERILARLREDLIGPLSDTEILVDRPTQRYSTGILYPRDSPMGPEEDDEGGLPVNLDEDVPSAPDVAGVSLHATFKPSSAGLSFAVRPTAHAHPPTARVVIRCGTYERVAVDDNGNRIEGTPPSRRNELWQRQPFDVVLPITLRAGEERIPLAAHGLANIEMYVLVTPQPELLTCTLALVNRRARGSSSAYDEAQHIFQTELLVQKISDGILAPRPSQRVSTDEDARATALIYRDATEYVVGHTCSASIVQASDRSVRELRTDWIPAVEVPAISDRGDQVFDGLSKDANVRPLDAQWLATAPVDALVQGLDRLEQAYREWIDGQRASIRTLDEPFKDQAELHIGTCMLGAERMRQGIAAIRDDVMVREAFQLAQQAMSLQFGWARKRAPLSWRPFQLGFQLLVLDSLARRTHPDRDVMDLLWFPTGGGKTEAYLALTAFIIFLRRLKGPIDGAGVAVLMRYTLRLLTIQQFQRAAAMICACELLRRRALARDERAARLGQTPISIGLWVGAAATPLTLADAVNRRPDDPSSAKQLTACPCCDGNLDWRITRQGSVVQCVSDPAVCDYAASGAQIPVWTIDEEIYRHAPSLLIGTVDKFAQIVRKPDTGILFGRRTPHAPPDLIIQDELHLISGPLGSMSGLYEVAVDELCRRDAIRPKVIGSTATIRRAADQCRALFDRSTYQFPAPCLDASNSGFAAIDTGKPGRLYVGVTTAGRSAAYMLQALAAVLLQATAHTALTPEERDYYWTLVLYFNSLRELGRALVLVQDDVPVSIGQYAARRDEHARIVREPAELTSRVPSSEIRDMLTRLKRRTGEPDAVDLLLASNMISVGMDIPRLGVMVVNAQPKTLSEYIQATSRVGRSEIPGVVVTMYNATRARDRSRYETFDTWHRCLYRDVEATTVTPFASRAQDRALHAVLVALVRHLVPGMETVPVLNPLRRQEVERIAATIEQRIARVDPAERELAAERLRRLIDEWVARPDLQWYWDDYGRHISLLMSAEQFAARASVDADLDHDGARRALWPTPNSMREVEPGTPFVLRHALRAEES